MDGAGSAQPSGGVAAAAAAKPAVAAAAEPAAAAAKHASAAKRTARPKQPGTAQRKGVAWAHRRKAPSNRSKMHERNRYRECPPDFVLLASTRPGLRQHLVGHGAWATLNWQEPVACIELTKALLEADFGLSWDLPVDRLCPTIPQKLNYIHWVEDLVSLSPEAAGSSVRGIDVGTGASCIYPLLGAAMHPEWRFVATEVDPRSHASATANVARNGLQTRIAVRTADPAAATVLRGPWLDEPSAGAAASAADDDAGTTPLLQQRYTFCMCNPPFFTSMDEAASNPSTACRGQEIEMVTPGGEVAFVGRMIEDSMHLREEIRWYTSMLGRKNSLRELLAKLRQAGIVNVRTTEFFQGKTTRWAIAWSFSDDGLGIGGTGMMSTGNTTENQDKVFAHKGSEASRRSALAFEVPKTCCPEPGEIWRRVSEFLDAGWTGFALKAARDRQTAPSTLKVGLTAAPVGLEPAAQKGGGGGCPAPPLESSERATKRPKHNGADIDGVCKSDEADRTADATAPAADSTNLETESTLSFSVHVVDDVGGAVEGKAESTATPDTSLGLTGTAAGANAETVTVTIQFLTGKDSSSRHIFWKLAETLQADILRNNRRWRRRQQLEAANVG